MILPIKEIINSRYFLSIPSRLSEFHVFFNLLNSNYSSSDQQRFASIPAPLFKLTASKHYCILEVIQIQFTHMDAE